MWPLRVAPLCIVVNRSVARVFQSHCRRDTQSSIFDWVCFPGAPRFFLPYIWYPDSYSDDSYSGDSYSDDSYSDDVYSARCDIYSDFYYYFRYISLKLENILKIATMTFSLTQGIRS